MRATNPEAFVPLKSYMYDYIFGTVLLASLISVLVLRLNNGFTPIKKVTDIPGYIKIISVVGIITILASVSAFTATEIVKNNNRQTEELKPEVSKLVEKGLNCTPLYETPDVCRVTTGLGITKRDCIPQDFHDIFIDENLNIGQDAYLSDSSKDIIKNIFPVGHPPDFTTDDQPQFLYNYEMMTEEILDKITEQIVSDQKTDDDKRRYIAMTILLEGKNQEGSRVAMYTAGILDKGVATGATPLDLCPEYNEDLPSVTPDSCLKQVRYMYIPTWYARDAGWPDGDICSHTTAEIITDPVPDS
jgi:hypothetical protein